MGVEKGLFSQDLIFVNHLTNSLNEFTIKEYDEDNIGNIINDSYSNGFTMIIILLFKKYIKNLPSNLKKLMECTIILFLVG